MYSPYDYLPKIDDPWKVNHMGIILGTGEWDNTRHESMRLSHILNSKGIQHLLDDRRWCGHDWNYWRDMLPYYLSLMRWDFVMKSASGRDVSPKRPTICFAGRGRNTKMKFVGQLGELSLPEQL